MSNMAPATGKPVDIARNALRKMAELGLPPTPENFADQYRRAAGLPPVDPAKPGDSLRGIEMESMLRGIVEMVSQTTTELTGGLDRFGGEVKGLLSKADDVDSTEGMRTLMQALTVSALSLQEAVDHSREELARTKAQLTEVATELERSESQARTDPLTGLFNRRGMDELIVREIARARRTKTPFSVALLDLDHFKKVNDEHGHDIGDKALLHLTAVAKSGIREVDVVCRYGGEEFVVVLPGAGADGAQFVIDRMRGMLEKTPLAAGSLKLQLRFSAGVAELGPSDTGATMLKRADQALYDAKRAGRNRVVVAAFAKHA
jgi:diguanylate cyclase